MPDQAHSNPLNSFCVVEQTIKQACVRFQAEFLPATLSPAQAQDPPRTTPPLIFSPRQGVDKTSTLILDFKRCTFSTTVTMNNSSNHFSSYESGIIGQTSICYYWVPMDCTSTEIKHNQVVAKKNGGDEGSKSKQFTLNYTAATKA